MSFDLCIALHFLTQEEEEGKKMNGDVHIEGKNCHKLIENFLSFFKVKHFHLLKLHFKWVTLTFMNLIQVVLVALGIVEILL